MVTTLCVLSLLFIFKVQEKQLKNFLKIMLISTIIPLSAMTDGGKSPLLEESSAMEVHSEFHPESSAHAIAKAFDKIEKKLRELEDRQQEMRASNSCRNIFYSMVLLYIFIYYR